MFLTWTHTMVGQLGPWEIEAIRAPKLVGPVDPCFARLSHEPMECAIDIGRYELEGAEH